MHFISNRSYWLAKHILFLINLQNLISIQFNDIKIHKVSATCVLYQYRQPVNSLNVRENLCVLEDSCDTYHLLASRPI